MSVPASPYRVHDRSCVPVSQRSKRKGYREGWGWLPGLGLIPEHLERGDLELRVEVVFASPTHLVGPIS